MESQTNQVEPENKQEASEPLNAKDSTDAQVTEPKQSCLHQIKDKIKEGLDWIRIIVLSIIAIALVLGLIYNFFAPQEKDLPPQFFSKLYKLIEEQGDGTLVQLIHPIDSVEWRSLNQNQTKN